MRLFLNRGIPKKNVHNVWRQLLRFFIILLLFLHGKYVFIEQLCKQHTPDMIGMRIKAPPLFFVLGRLKRKHHKEVLGVGMGKEGLDVDDAFLWDS